MGFHLTALQVVAAGLLLSKAQSTVLNEYRYCIRYFGSMTAELEFPDIIPTYNTNGTILCPTSMNMPRVSGATLTICPKYGYEDNQAVVATLSLSSSGILDQPIDGLDLGTMLITNGSVAGTFPNDGIPALLAPDLERSEPGLPVWTINGTQYSLVDSPSENSTVNSVSLDCRDIKDPELYCGDWDDAHGRGCWSSQQFNWNLRSPLDYTIRFSNKEATVDINTASEMYWGDGTLSGGLTHAYLSFGGDRNLPSVVDYDFWENAEQDYEVEKANLHLNIQLHADEQSMPLFQNTAETTEWYDSANVTFSTESAAMSVRGEGGCIWLVSAVVTAVVAGLL